MSGVTDDGRQGREAASSSPSSSPSSSSSLSPVVAFLSPAIGAVGSACVAKVCDGRSLEHGMLLSSILNLRGDEKTASAIVALLEAESPLLVRRGSTGQTAVDSEESKVVFLCSSLMRSIGLEDLAATERDEDRVRLAESVVGSVVYLLSDEPVGMATAERFLGRIVQVGSV